MSLTVTCEKCHRLLRIDEDVSREPLLTCPRCLNAFFNPRYNGVRAEAPRTPRALIPNLERDVSLDRKGSNIGLCVLGGLILLGIIAFTATGGFTLVSASPNGPFIFGFAVLILVALIAGFGYLIYFSKDRTAQAVSTVLGTFTIFLVGLVAFALLVLSACCAGLADCGKSIH